MERVRIKANNTEWVQSCACEGMAAAFPPFPGPPRCTQCGSLFVPAEILAPGGLVANAREIIYRLIVAVGLGETPALDPGRGFLEQTGGLPGDLAAGAEDSPQT